ncbi:hypothetical protein LI177_11225 [bacterium 210820-DFI.6.37]|nr:hypothetical protein [bacterium 210820-DFI.6.37]
MYDILLRVSADRDFQQKLLEQYEERLRTLPEGVLCYKEKGGKRYYYKQEFKDGIRRQIYIPKACQDQIEDLKLKRFLEESIKRFRKNIQAEDKLLKAYREYDPNLIQDALPKAYIPLPKGCFFDTDKTDRYRWEQSRPESNQRYELEKIHITPKGLRVQSKGELIIASALEAKNIPFRYNEKLTLGNHTIHPDFKVIDKRRNMLMCWEHFGMMEDKGYFEMVPWKLKLYQEHGYFIFDRLIVTADAPNGAFDARIVDNIIRLFFETEA